MGIDLCSASVSDANVSSVMSTEVETSLDNFALCAATTYSARILRFLDFAPNDKDER